MPGRSDEIEACVHAEVDLITPARLLLLEHIRLMLVVKELNDGHPGISVVHVVAEAGGINNGQADCSSHQCHVVLGETYFSCYL